MKNEISRLEKELEQKKAKEKKSIEDYDNISKQSFLVNKLIANLRAEENQKQSEIEKLTGEIKSIEDEINTLQKNYSKYVVASYKYGNYTEWESILDAASFQQAVIRLEYLKRFSAKRKIDLIEYQKNKEELKIAKEKLQKEKEEKRILTDQKVIEEKSLEKKLGEKKIIIKAIKKDKSKLAKAVNEKRKSEQKIKDLIIKLVEDAERKEKEAELKKTETIVRTEKKTTKEVPQGEYNIDLNTSKFNSFSELKGDLNWPISNGKIVKRFGENKNEKLNTVTVNYGIDIKTSGDLSVKCVAEGVVSAVEWLPGYGTVLIMSHKGNYRTVYGHLSQVFVNEGDKVKTGGVIANIGESVEGNILHFEIWNARQNINPEIWLRK
ncbi:MAG TPA: peptidoglycan DD-metalloendopeptidase family protein [Ignavibacteriaceae bacterium]|nr:peptidoglycan DD-metalloendopeptidase family protein [Ignavibacteriaceae bacterium]